MLKHFIYRFRDSLILIPALIAIAVIVFMVAFSPSELVYDESYHLEGARLLIQGSSIYEMLKAKLNSAPGPLYPVIHALIFPLTGFLAPSIRVLNIFFLIVSIAAIFICLRFYGIDKSLYRSTSIISVPIIWVTSGMALTEIPAFTMATLSLLAATYATRNETTKQLSYYSFMASGLFAGLACLGRQTYFPMIFIFLVLAFSKRAWRWSSISGFLIACMIVLPTLIVWGGLVPKSQSYVAGGINLNHGFLSIAYLSSVIAILAPSFFAVLLSRWKLMVSGIFMILITNILVFQFKFKALTGLIKFLPFSEDFYSLIIGSILLLLSIAFISAIILNVLENYDDKVFLIMSSLTILGASTAFGINHLFSSRYIMTCFPFILIMIQRFYYLSLWSMFRIVLGGALGAATLASYYRWI